jgi:hypothetical protein
MTPPRRKHTDVIREHLPLAGRLAVDVGCGDGALVRFLARQGARAVGLDCGTAALAPALAADRTGGEAYVAALGQALPFAESSLDVVVFFNSLHHVPEPDIPLALAEAARVLRRGGHLYVMEPLAEGAYFELVRPVEDETAVRAAAYAAVCEARAEAAFDDLAEVVYDAPVKLADFDTFRRKIVAANPARAAAVAAQQDRLAAGFAAAGDHRDGAVWFAQPSRLNLLLRR